MLILSSLFLSATSPAQSDPGLTGPANTVGEAGRHTRPKTVYALLFGGQSNALGWGYRQYLEYTNDPLAKPQRDVEMFYEIAGQGFLPEDTLLPLPSAVTAIQPVARWVTATASNPLLVVNHFPRGTATGNGHVL